MSEHRDAPGPRLFEPILDLFLQNDAATVREIRAAIEGVVLAFHVGRDQVSDLVQESLKRLIVSLREGRFQGHSSLKTYAQSVAKYTCLEFRRLRRNESRLDPDSVPSRERWSSPDQAVLDLEEHRMGLEAFASLPEETRQLFLLVFMEELSYREVSTRLGITEGATRSRIHRLRLACRQMFGHRAARHFGAHPVRERVRER